MSFWADHFQDHYTYIRPEESLLVKASFLCVNETGVSLMGGDGGGITPEEKIPPPSGLQN